MTIIWISVNIASSREQTLLLIGVLEIILQHKKSKKNSQLIVRINDQERAEFVKLCDELDTSAAREVRRFIRDFLTQHKDRD